MKHNFIITLLVLSLTTVLTAQKGEPVFTTIKENGVTPVKNQANSGTCWSYSGLGFFESELLRQGKPVIDLSEMFVVSHSYTDKGDKYVRTNGHINFSAGGSFYDVVYVWKNYGIVPEFAMRGLNYGEEKNNHGELDALTKSVAKSVVTNPNKKLSPAWKKAYQGIIDAYLGKRPTDFVYNGVTYTPKTFADYLGLNMDDYISLTSYTHHPFYTRFAIEIPDNWRWSESYNLPLEEFSRVFDYAIDNGYTIAWGSDVSEKGFTGDGIGVLPEVEKTALVGSDQAKWLEKQARQSKYTITREIKEQTVTQTSRQEGFDSYQTTDDHGMQIYGKAKDQYGKIYYMVKNSWGTDNKHEGVWYITKPFIEAKTMNILLHKDAIPQDIRKKIGL